MIPDHLAHLARPVEDVICLPENARQGDIGAIAESLRRHGQQTPIVVNADGIILKGNHTYQAAVHLGWTRIAVLTSDLEGADQSSYALADNRTSDLASYDDDALLAQLDTAADLAGSGYTPQDVAALHRHVGNSAAATAFLDDYIPEPESERRIVADPSDLITLTYRVTAAEAHTITAAITATGAPSSAEGLLALAEAYAR